MTPQQRTKWGREAGKRDRRMGRPLLTNPFLPSASHPEMYAGYQAAWLEEDAGGQCPIILNGQRMDF